MWNTSGKESDQEKHRGQEGPPGQRKPKKNKLA